MNKVKERKGGSRMARELLPLSELEDLCNPIVNWLRENGNPYTFVKISDEGIEVTEIAARIPIQKTADS